MPTGYTAAVQAGEITELRPFALKCARAFGALITMRDEPQDKPIPARFEADTRYHDAKLAAAVRRLDELRAMTPAELEAAAEAEYQAQMQSYAAIDATMALHRERYESMIAKVEAWRPPEACDKLKEFMLSQLRESLDFDCVPFRTDKPVREGAEAYLARAMKGAEWDIDYHTNGRREEISRVEERNLWLDALRASLA